MNKQNQIIAEAQSMSSLQISEITGKRHDAVLRDIRNLLEQGVNAHNFVAVEYTDAKGEQRPCYHLTKKGCLILASGYNAVLREKIIDRWEELESGKAQPIVTQQPQQQLSLADKMKAASWAAKFLNLNENSKLIIAKQILEPLGLPTPEYTTSKGILKSASELLRECNSPLRVREFNAQMIKCGYLADMTRKAAKGAIKHFKSITTKGKQFGENQVSPKAPNQTQPMYYAEKFDSLLNSLGKEVAAL